MGTVATMPAGDVLRTRLILALADGQTSSRIEDQLGMATHDRTMEGSL